MHSPPPGTVRITMRIPNSLRPALFLAGIALFAFGVHHLLEVGFRESGYRFHFAVFLTAAGLVLLLYSLHTPAKNPASVATLYHIEMQSADAAWKEQTLGSCRGWYRAGHDVGRATLTVTPSFLIFEGQRFSTSSPLMVLRFLLGPLAGLVDLVIMGLSPRMEAAFRLKDIASLDNLVGGIGPKTGLKVELPPLHTGGQPCEVTLNRKPSAAFVDALREAWNRAGAGLSRFSPGGTRIR